MTKCLLKYERRASLQKTSKGSVMSEFNNEAFLKRLEWCRENLKRHSQREVAAVLGWKGSGYADIAKGRKRCTLQSAVELAGYFKVPLSFLVHGKTEPEQMPLHLLKAIEQHQNAANLLIQPIKATP